MTKGEELFIDQMARKKMVDWCSWAIEKPTAYSRELGICIPESDAPYRDFAVSKKWLSPKYGPTGANKILSAGWETASRFLKR